MADESWRANYTTSGFRAVGGKLTLSGGRLEFRPHGLDRALAGRGFQTDVGAISSVGREGRTLNPLSGGMRTRLRIETADGQVALFVVNKLDQVIERIEAARSEAAAG